MFDSMPLNPGSTKLKETRPHVGKKNNMKIQMGENKEEEKLEMVDV